MPLKQKSMAALQGDPASGGSYTYAQLEGLWISEGGDPTAAPMAAAIALAESGGKANATNHNTNGSTDRGLWQINSVHGAQSTYNVKLNTRAAISISGNGKDWSPWTTFQTGAYKKYLQSGVAPQGGGPAGSGGGGGGGGGGGLGIGSIADLFSAPVDAIGGWLASIAVNLIKDIAIGIGDYVIIPFWHWNQRAVDQYQQAMFGDKSGMEIVWNGAFWGLGYYLLFTDPDANHFKPAPAQRSRLARHVRAAQSLPARRSLIKPKHVREQTPLKPAPVTSTAAVRQVSTMSTERHQTVRVTGGTESSERIKQTGSDKLRGRTEPRREKPSRPRPRRPSIPPRQTSRIPPRQSHPEH